MGMTADAHGLLALWQAARIGPIATCSSLCDAHLLPAPADRASPQPLSAPPCGLIRVVRATYSRTLERAAAMAASGSDLRDMFVEKKRNTKLLQALATIHAQCAKVKERQGTARQLHTRLHQVFLRATSLSTSKTTQILSSRKRLATFSALLESFHSTLKRHSKLHSNVVRRALHHRMFSLQLRSIHHQLTAFLRGSVPSNELELFPIQWRDTFEVALRQDENLLHETLMTVIKSTSFLSKEYTALSTQQQMTVLLDVRSELGKHIDMSPVLTDCLKTIYRRLVRLFGWDLSEASRRVPWWFIATSAIEYSSSRDVLTRAKATYRGEIAIEEHGGLKRHLVVMKVFSGAIQTDPHVDETLRAIDVYMNKYGGVEHPLILRIRGANYAAGSPFVVRDFATQGTLGGYVARLRHSLGPRNQFDECIVWRLLADACEGLIHLHACDHLVHGGLRGSNVLVNHRGRAVLADVGVRLLKHELRTPLTQDDEYVRWMAPELMPRIKGHRQVDYSADIFAFGMTILEVASGHLPWGGLDWARVEEVKLTRAVLPPRPSSMRNRAWRLIERMCVANPSKRLSLEVVHDQLLELSRAPEGDAPDSFCTAASNDKGEDSGDRRSEFETESVSSYKTTIEVGEENQEGVEGDDVDSMEVLVPDDEDEQLNSESGRDSSDEADINNELALVVSTYSDRNNSLPVSTFAALEIDSSDCGPIGMQTSGQTKTAIDFLVDNTIGEPAVLIPHLQLLRAFARQDVESIHDGGGVRVLHAVLSKHSQNATVRECVLETFTAMLASGRANIAESIVDQGVIAIVYECLLDKSLSKEQVNLCVSLVVELMGLTDDAKRHVGSTNGFVKILEDNDKVHHRLLQEIKSVLARFKQTEGNELLKEGFHVLAIQKFTEAIQLDRRRGIYYADRSLAFCHARRYEEAAEDAERCVRYNPFDVQGYVRYGIAMKHMNKYSEAMKALRKGYQVNPNSPHLASVMEEVQQLYNTQTGR